MDEDRLHGLYWQLRPEYDVGKLTGLGFWQKLAREAELTLSEAQLDELNDWDARLWTTENPAMLAWQQQVKQHGLRTAILSNMGDHVCERLVKVFDWLPRFDVLIWSYELGVVKPDEAIYRYALNELDMTPEEVFFLDDKAPNIAAARALGMRCHQFTTVDRLREELIAQGLESELPLPA